MFITVPVKPDDMRQWAITLAAQAEVLRQRGDMGFARQLNHVCALLRGSASRLETPFMPKSVQVPKEELDRATG